MHNALFEVLEFLSGHFILLGIISLTVQVGLSSFKNKYWGWILSTLEIITLYWMANPPPSRMAETPAMTSMYGMRWIP